MNRFSNLIGLSLVTGLLVSSGISTAQESVASDGRVNIKLAVNGVKLITDKQKANIYLSSKLKIDGNAYQGGSGLFEMVRFSEGVVVKKPNDVVFTGFGPNREVSIVVQKNSYYLSIKTKAMKDAVSDLWLSLKPNAGTEKAKARDIELNNGWHISMLGRSGEKVLGGSPALVCSTREEGGSIVYTVQWNGNDVNSDGTADKISFDVHVSGYEKSEYSKTAENSRFASITKLGEQIKVGLNDWGWGVGENGMIDTAETMRFVIKNVEVSVPGYRAEVSSLKSFRFKSDQTDKDYHKGLYSEKLEGKFKHFAMRGEKAFELAPASSCLVSKIGGDTEAGFNISELDLHFKILNPDAAIVYDPSDYSGSPEGIAYKETYSKQKAGVVFPDFSWKKIPRWLPVRKHEEYTAQEIEQIAKNYEMVMLEKDNANGLEHTEEGTLKMAAALKKVNPDIKVLAYWNALIHYPFYKANQEVDEVSRASWFTGTHSRNKLPLYNRNNTEFRKWWVGAALSMVNDENIDGILIDTIGRDGLYFYDESGDPSSATYTMFDDLRKQMPAEKMMVVNILKHYIPNASRQMLECFDGAYLENWNLWNRGVYDRRANAYSIGQTIQYMQEALDRGKMINFYSRARFKVIKSSKIEDKLEARKLENMQQHAQKQVTFPLGIFLIGASENAYFSHSLGVGADIGDRGKLGLKYSNRVWDTSYIPEFNRPLGKPLGPAVKDGDVYTREFEYLKLTVDVKARTTIFEWAKDADADGVDDEEELEKFGSVFTQ